MKGKHAINHMSMFGGNCIHYASPARPAKFIKTIRCFFMFPLFNPSLMSAHVTNIFSHLFIPNMRN